MRTVQLLRDNSLRYLNCASDQAIRVGTAAIDEIEKVGIYSTLTTLLPL